MYKIFCDSYLLYDDTLEGYDVFNAKIELQLNTIGKFEFTIYPGHTHYDRLQKLKSVITVYQGDYLLFRGRILDDEQGFYNEKNVVCESDLAYLIDSIQRPYDFSGTLSEYFTQLITSHNGQVETAKGFTIGTVTLTGDITVSDAEYLNTWETISKKIIEPYGGYVRTRKDGDTIYIDLLASYSTNAAQSVDFGINLLDLKKTIKGDDVSTAVIPLGAKEEGSETRLTIESVNNGVDYVYDADAVDDYGRIYIPVIFDDITDASALLTAGQTYLTNSVLMYQTIDLDAADLATLGNDIQSFRLGSSVMVTSAPHNLNQRFVVDKLSIDLLNPASNKLTLGKTLQTLTERAETGQIDVFNRVVNITSDLEEKLLTGLNETERKLSAQIVATSESITSTVADEYYLKTDTDALIESVSTEVTQTAEDMEIRFTEFSQDIDAVIDGTDAQFEEINKYIRFVDGNIVLGEDTNTLTLHIENDRIAFLDSGVEVAYFSNNKLHVTDGEFLNSLQLGQFAFIPRTNGNMSLKKID